MGRKGWHRAEEGFGEGWRNRRREGGREGGKEGGREEGRVYLVFTVPPSLNQVSIKMFSKSIGAHGMYLATHANGNITEPLFQVGHQTCEINKWRNSVSWIFASICDNNNISDTISYYVSSTTVLRTLHT